MADSEVQKRWVWQWPGKQKPEALLLVRITKLKKQGPGLFGINKTPSIITNLPNAYILEGYVVDGDEEFNNTKISLLFPRSEEENIQTNDYVALGIIKSHPQKNIFICMEKVPNDLSLAEKLKWLESWKCPKP